MSADIYSLGGTNQPPKKTVLALSMGAVHTLRAPHVLPPRLSCDALGMCQHTALDCGERCQREALDDGHVDVPLPAMGGGNFWLDQDPRDDPTGFAPGAQQPHLMDVVPRPPTTGEIVWFWVWVFMTYLFCVALGGWAWAKWGESAARAFWRVISGVS